MKTEEVSGANKLQLQHRHQGTTPNQCDYDLWAGFGALIFLKFPHVVLIYSQTVECWCTISVFWVGTRDSERGHKGYTVVERNCLSSGLHLGTPPFL